MTVFAFIKFLKIKFLLDENSLLKLLFSYHSIKF